MGSVMESCHGVSHEVGHVVIQMIGKEVDHGVGSIDKSHFRSSLCRSFTSTCKVSTRCRRDRPQYSTIGPMCPSTHPFLSQILSFPCVSKYYKKNYISESILKEGLDRQWQTKESRDCKTEYKISFPFRQI